MAFADTFKALSDPARREILQLLKNGRMSAGEIGSHFHMTGATVSYHLKILKKADLIWETKEKNFILKNISEIYVEEDILKLGELLKEYRERYNQSSGRIKYNSIKNDRLGQEIKTLTKRIKKYLFNDSTSILYSGKKDINNDLQKLNDYFDMLNQNNNIEELIQNNSIVNKKQEYIDNYIFNSIVNHSLYKYNQISLIVKNKSKKDIISIEDLIQELAYQNREKKLLDDKKRRKQILDNYFEGTDSITRFPNKYKVEKALKNINYEMEKASQEFSKLFNYDSKNH